MPSKKKHVNNPHYRVYDHLKYELLRRRAFDETGNSIQRVIDKYVFQEGWQIELERRREVHRSSGEPDSKFLPARRGMKTGRRKIPVPSV